jgi:hypothetical protein
MLFRADRPFWKVALQPKDAGFRTQLEHVMIEKQDAPADADGFRPGLAIAADGFMLAVQVVRLEADDVPGLVHCSRFEQAIKRTPRATRKNWNGDIRMELGAEAVTYMDRATERRVTQDALQFPNYGRVVPSHTGADAPRARILNFNPKLYAILCAALGEEGKVVLMPGKDEFSPLLLETRLPDEHGRPVAPYGVLMPMHTAMTKDLLAWEGNHAAPKMRPQAVAS